MATVNNVLNKAASYIGIGGTDNIFNTWYWGFHCYDPNVYPWCAAYVSYVLSECGLDGFSASASASGVAYQFSRVADEEVQPGDIVIFTWDGRQDFSWSDHIGFVEWSDINGSGYFGTIEGNTGNSAGGEVLRQTRFNWGIYGTAFFRPNYSEDKPAPAPKPEEAKRLHGIDISSWQDGIDVASVDADFVIIKVTGGDWYINPYWQKWAYKAIKANKLVGFYHYAAERGSARSAEKEAQFFLKELGDYANKGILILDWENDALSYGVEYAKSWLDYVAKKTGSMPVFYGYASNVNSTDYSSISGYPLWMASYLNRYADGHGHVDNPVNTWNTGAWNSMIMYQYASTRTVDGYDGNLDLNVFYGSKKDWKNLIGGKAPEVDPGYVPDTDQPYYNVMVDGQWCGMMQGLYDTSGSGDDYGGIYGNSMQYIAIGGVGKYRVYTAASGWLPWVDRYDLNDYEYGMAGDGSAIQALEIADGSVHYMTKNIYSDWNSEMVGQYDTGGSGDTFAGVIGVSQDAVKIWR